MCLFCYVFPTNTAPPDSTFALLRSPFRSDSTFSRLNLSDSQLERSDPTSAVPSAERAQSSGIGSVSVRQNEDRTPFRTFHLRITGGVGISPKYQEGGVVGRLLGSKLGKFRVSPTSAGDRIIYSETTVLVETLPPGPTSTGWTTFGAGSGGTRLTLGSCIGPRPP